MKFLLEQLNIFPRTWNWFWFDSKSNDNLLNLAIFRISFYSVMFFCYLARAQDVEYFYSENGLLPSWYRSTVDFFKFHPSPLDGITNPLVLNGLHTIFLLVLVILIFGYKTRIFAPIAYLLHLTFINRNMGVQFGVDMIGTFYFCYMCFANSNSALSLDSKFKKSNNKQSTLSHISWRLMQLQLCVVYGYSGIEKLKGTRWWDGSAIWDVLSMGTMQRWDLSFVAHMPIILAVIAYLVLFWEIYFPILIWGSKTRLLMLYFGFFMHIGIFLFMNLPSFGFLMLSLYTLFLKREEIEKILHATVRLPTKHN